MALGPSELTTFSYTVPNAAKALGISRGTIYRLLKSGKLKAFKIGRRTLLSAVDLEKFVSDQPRVDSPPSPASGADASQARPFVGRPAQRRSLQDGQAPSPRSPTDGQ